MLSDAKGRLWVDLSSYRDPLNDGFDANTSSGKQQRAASLHPRWPAVSSLKAYQIARLERAALMTLNDYRTTEDRNPIEWDPRGAK